MAREERSVKRVSLREKAKQRAEENKFTGGSSYIRLPDGCSFLKPKEGTNRWDFLPYEVTIGGTVHDGKTKDVVHTVGDLEYVRTTLVHPYMGADEKSYLCLRVNKKPCPFCDERTRLSKLPAPKNQDEAKALEKEINTLKPKIKDIWNVIDLDDSGKGVQLLEFSYANWREILEEEIREGKDEWAGFADLEEGFTVKARFSAETFDGNKFLKCSRVDFDPRDGYKETILKKVVDLDACLIVETYDKLKAIMWGAEGEPEAQAGRGADVNEDRVDRSDRADRAERGSASEDRAERGSRSERPAQQETEIVEKKEEPVQASTRTPRQLPPVEKECPAGKCPVGHVFGVDCDNTPDCHKCDSIIWEPCRDEADRLAKAKK
jgi:hypothetical protein